MSHWPLSISKSLVALLNICLPVVLSRMLAIEDLAVYKIFFLYAVIGPWTWLASAIDNGVYTWSQVKGSMRLVGSSFVMALAVSGLWFLGIFVLSDVLLPLLDLPKEYGVYFALIASVPKLSVIAESCLIADGKIMRVSLFHAAFEIIRLSAVIVVAFYTSSLELVLLSYTILVCLKGVIIIPQAVDFSRLELPRLEDLKVVSKYITPLLVAILAEVLINEFDKILLIQQMSKTDYAFFIVGCLVIPPLGIIENSACSVLITKLANKGKERIGEGWMEYRKAVADISFVMIPAVFAMYIFSDEIVTFLYGEKFSQSGVYFSYFVFSYLALIIPHDAVARALQDSRWMMRNNIKVALCALPISFIAVWFFGIEGAFAAILIKAFLLRGFGFFYCRRAANWSTQKMLPFSKLGEYTLASLLAAMVIFFLKGFAVYERYWLFLGGATFSVLYLTMTTCDFWFAKMGRWSWSKKLKFYYR